MTHPSWTWSALGAWSLGVCLACSAPEEVATDPPRGFEQLDLFVSGTHSTHTFRIPALAVTPRGTLIAVVDARRDGAGDLPGDIDLVMRRSVDGGATWSPLEVIQDLPEGHGAGDASLVVDHTTGRVFCFFAYGPPGVGFFTSRAGSSASDDTTGLHAHVIWSDDEGETWSPPRDLTPALEDPSWRALFASSGVGVQLRSGRLVQPFAVLDGTGRTSSRNALSDDHGATWRMGGPAGERTNESRVVELRSGEVLQSLRHDDVPARFFARSRDGGETFGAMERVEGLRDPRVNVGLVRLPAGQLVHSGPWSDTERVDLEVRVSHDDGATWHVARRLHTGPAAYSALVHLPDGALAVLYERGERSPYERVTFARFPLP